MSLLSQQSLILLSTQQASMKIAMEQSFDEVKTLVSSAHKKLLVRPIRPCI